MHSSAAQMNVYRSVPEIPREPPVPLWRKARTWVSRATVLAPVACLCSFFWSSRAEMPHAWRPTPPTSEGTVQKEPPRPDLPPAPSLGAVAQPKDPALPNTDRPFRQVMQTIFLTGDRHGIVGELQLLRDARIDDAKLDELWRGGGGDTLDALSAQLVLKDASGRILESENYQEPLAKLSEIDLLDARKTLTLTIDYSTGSGSSGPHTRFFDVRDGQLHWFRAVQADGALTHLDLVDALNRYWRIKPSQRHGGSDLAYTECRYRPSEQDFYATHTRYMFDGEIFVADAHTKVGACDFS